jgi:hypothetical protein
MFRNAFKGFPGEVQAVEFRVMAFQMGHDPDRLRVVIEPAIGRHRGGERVLPGMPEGGMAEIMGQRHGLGQVLVEAQRAGHGARDLRHLQRMGQAGAEIVALMLHEDLRLVLEPAKRGGMDDPVAVALERASGRRFPPRHAAATAWAGSQAKGARMGRLRLASQVGGRDLFGPPLPHIFPPEENRPFRRKDTPAMTLTLTVPPKVTDRAFARLAEINGLG